MSYFYQQNHGKPTSFDGVPESDLEAFLKKDRYGDFELTDAIRPSYDLRVVPQEGYRHSHWTDRESGDGVPVLIAAVTREKLFDVFMDLMEPLGMIVDVVLETSHKGHRRGHADLRRGHIDLSVLQSTLWNFEDLLTNDGCTGIAILNPRAHREVQFDEHKLIIVYAETRAKLAEFEGVLGQNGLSCNEKLCFITSAEHVHSSSDVYARTFEDLATQLGLDEYAEDQATY